MGAVVQKATSPEGTIEPTTGIRHPEVDAVARTGGFDALNRVSSTLDHVCGVLTKHLRSAANDDERRLLDRVITTVGNVSVAVRLSRFQAQARQDRAVTCLTPSCDEMEYEEPLNATAVATIHCIQWTALESCHAFLAEWEDVEVITPAAADCLLRDAESFMEGLDASLIEVGTTEHRAMNHSDLLAQIRRLTEVPDDVREIQRIILLLGLPD